jgi:tellurite resistance protein
MRKPSITLVAAAVCALSASACSHVKPWERSKLAHHTMSSAGFDGPAQEHVYSVQEGAAGGGAAAESGCGCN